MGQKEGIATLMAHLLYGPELRITGRMTLRVEDVDPKADLIHAGPAKGTRTGPRSPS